MKTIEDATVAELDALAEEHQIADYPAGGNKAEKYAVVAAALGEGYEFEAEAVTAPEEMIVVGLVDDVNAAQFGIGFDQVEIVAGDTLEVEARVGRRLVGEQWFLVSPDVDEPAAEPPPGAFPEEES